MIFLPVWRYFHEKRELKETYKRYLKAAQIVTEANEIKWKANQQSVDDLVFEDNSYEQKGQNNYEYDDNRSEISMIC